jgi:DNA-binding CsgD family transcriptional regulator
VSSGRSGAASLTEERWTHARARGPALEVVAPTPEPPVTRGRGILGDVTGASPWPAAGHRTLRGLHLERQRLDDLLHALGTGHGQVLVVHGAAGAGKTALLDDLAERATGCRTIRVAGVATEARLPYAGLHQLCLPMLDRLAGLPTTHAEALRAAVGLGGAALPSPLLVGLGLLALLADLAAERPVLCVIDDAQWLDPASAQALGVAVRRLGAHPIATVIAVREPSHDEPLASLPGLRLAGLDDADAGAVLDAAVTGPLDERIRARVVAEARGNPGALLDALRDVAPEAAAGGLGLALAEPIDRLATEDDLRAIAALPEATRRLLLIAALEPFGDPATVLAAAAGGGLGRAAATAATHAGLLTIDGLVRFRDPHLRRVVHAAATPQERLDAQRALAGATTDAACASWHRGHGTAWPDEAVAARLERAAEQVLSRGGTATGAALAQRAVELSPGAPERAQRALIAAEAMHDAGAEEASLRLLAAAEAGPLNDARRARARLLRGRVAHKVTRGDDAPGLLLDAADQLRDPALAADAHREALLAAMSAGTLARGRTVVDVAAAIAHATTSDPSADPLLTGFSTLVLAGPAAAAPALARALAAVPASTSLTALSLGCVAARARADDAAWERQSARLLQLGRERGVLATVPGALGTRLMFELLSGQLSIALELADELRVATARAGARASMDPDLWLAAWRGRADEALALTTSRRPDAIRRGNGQWLNLADWLCAMLFNGAGRYDDALTCADRSPGHPYDIGFAFWRLPELVEAAVRSGDVARARPPAAELSMLAAASGTDWALGLAARGQALVDPGDGAEARYREAIARLGRTRMRSALARTHLVYGEWLRRHGRRVDAREQLGAAHDMLAAMGADAFADRARRELVATGATVRRRTTDALDDLTPQEAEIARLAASGQTNREIGTQLFLSPRTVEWHLRKVFSKVGVSSRRELTGALGGAAR